MGSGRLRTLKALTRALGASIGVNRGRTAVLISQRGVTAEGSGTGLRVRQAWARGAVFINIARRLGKGTLAIQSIALLGNELATFLLRHASWAKGAVLLRAIRQFSKHSCKKNNDVSRVSQSAHLTGE